MMVGKPSVFLDADVIFAGAASPSEHGASYVILRLGELTLLDCVTCAQAVVEVERNLAEKLPAALPTFRLLVSRCLRVVPDPTPADQAPYVGHADPKDLPILVAALREGCSHLLTFNVGDYHPAGERIAVQRPGEYLLALRVQLATLASGQ